MNTSDDPPDWSLLQTFLPAGWEEQARSSGAFQRVRQVASPSALLRLVLVVCGVGLSYQRTTEVAELGGVGKLSKVSLWRRLQRCGPWLEWLVERLLAACVERPLAAGYTPRGVDGSVMAGPKGRVQVRLHFALDLLTLRPSQARVTGLKQGEALSVLSVAPGDLWIGDQGYATVKNVATAKAGGGEVIFRLGRRTLRLWGAEGRPLGLLALCRQAPGYAPLWCEASCHDGAGGRTAGRVVVLRLRPAVAARAQCKVRRTVQRTQQRVSAETEEMAGYLCVFTTAERLSPDQVLAWYAARWQVELAFKRLKSLLGASDLRATSEERARVWLLGKMVYALLLHACLDHAEAFSPWGNPVPGSAREGSAELRPVLGADGVDEHGAGRDVAGLRPGPAPRLAGRARHGRGRTLPAATSAADAGAMGGGGGQWLS